MPASARALRRAAVVAIVLAAAAALAVLLRQVGPAGAALPCGNTPVLRVDGRAMACSFDDEFSGRTLDRRLWQVADTRAIGFHAGLECDIDRPDTVGVAGGALRIWLRQGPVPPTCRAAGTRYVSALLVSRRPFALTYGRVEFRARFPAGAGLHSALWLYPARLGYGPWPASGEIDVAEYYGSHPGVVVPNAHFRSARGPAAPGRPCAVPGADGAFHRYTLDWLPGLLRFSYDGRPCWQLRGWRPARPLAAPAPFDRPFDILLDLAMDDLPASHPTAQTRLPAALVVDYVRAWQLRPGT